MSARAAAADLERTFVEVLAGVGQPYVVASFMRSNVATTLKRRDNVMAGGNDAESAALRSYYNAMIRGRPDQAASLFLETDGSRRRFRDGLAALSTRYDGYRTLSEVTVAEYYGWGPFRLAVVALLGNDGRRQNWREALVCTGSSCLFSNAIDTPDDSFALFAQVRNAQTASNRTQAELERFFATASRAQLLPQTDVGYPGVQQHPLEIAVRLDTPARGIDVALPFTGRAVVVNRVDITPVVVWLSDLIRIDLGGTAVMAGGGGSQSEIDAIESSVRDVIAARADPETADAGFHFVSAFAPSMRLDVEWYQPVAALQRVQRWKSIRIIGLMTVGQEVAVFYQPTQKITEESNTGLVEPIQVAVLRRAPGEPRILLAGVGSPFEFVYSNALARIIGANYGAAVTFVYQP